MGVSTAPIGYAVDGLMNCATSRKVAGSIPDGVTALSFRPHYGRGVDSLWQLSAGNIFLGWGVKMVGA